MRRPLLMGKFPVVLQKIGMLTGYGPYAQYFDVMLNSIGFAEVDPWVHVKRLVSIGNYSESLLCYTFSFQKRWRRVTFAARINHRVVFDKNTNFGSTLTPISLDRSGSVSICSKLIDIPNDGMLYSPKMTSKQAVSSYDEKTRQGEGKKKNMEAL